MFSEAFEDLRAGHIDGFRLQGWSQDVVIRLQVPDINSKMSHEYLYVESRFGKVPWMPTIVELFSTKYEVI